METQKYNKQEMFRTAFRFVPYAPINTVRKVMPVGGYENIGIAQKEALKSSMLGTPIFMPCTLDDVLLPNEPLIEISGSISMVKTEIDGQDGTFKEQFSINDYQVIIRGIAVQEDGSDDYPEAQISAIRSLCERRNNKVKHVSVANDLCGLFGIGLLVIESWSFPSVEGAQSWQPYQLNCLSDKIFDIELANG